MDMPYRHLPHRRDHAGHRAPAGTGCVAGQVHVANFTKHLACAAGAGAGGAGLKHPNDITAHLADVRRLDDNQVSSVSNLILRVEARQSAAAVIDKQHKVFQSYWPLATARSFQPLHEPISSHRPRPQRKRHNHRLCPRVAASGPDAHAKRLTDSSPPWIHRIFQL